MSKHGNIEDDLELRYDTDSNESDTDLPRKKEKKGKSKEQKSKERRVIFWTLFVVVLITAAFWLLSILKSDKVFFGDDSGIVEEKVEKENYVKYDI